MSKEDEGFPYKLDMPENTELGFGQLNPARIIRSYPSLEKTYRQVDIPPEYMRSLVDRGKKTERELEKKYNSSPVTEMANGLWNSFEEKVIGKFVEVYIPKDRTLEVLKKKLSPENFIINDILQAASELDLEEYEELLDEKDAESSACSAVGCKKGTKEKKLPRTLRELKNIEELNNSSKAMVYRTFSLDSKPDDLYNEENDLWKTTKKLEDYGFDPRRTGYAVPMTLASFVRGQENLNPNKIENFAKNTVEMKRPVRYIDSFLEETEDEKRKRNAVRESNRLLSNSLDHGTQRNVWKVMMAAPQKIDVALEQMNDEIDRRGGLGDWRTVAEVLVN